MWGRFLFSVAAGLFSPLWLVLLPAPTSWLLIVAIVLAEWSHYTVLGALLVAALSWRRGALGKTGALLAIIAAVICATPLLRAIAIARTLPQRCDSAFGLTKAASGRMKPFDAVDLFRGVPTDGLDVTEYVYASDGSKALALDLYQLPGTIEPQPLIVVVHGGSWNRSSKAELPAINRYLAREGFTVASINYRHAPRWPFPAAIDDVFRAIEFLRGKASELRLDATRIVVLGRSAGGQIALCAAYANRDPAIRGVVAFYPPTDLVLGYANPSARWVLDSKAVLENYLGGSPAERRTEYEAASPVNQVGPSTPPTLLVHGGLDSVVWPKHSELLDARLREAGRSHLYLSLGWATHGCDANLSGPSGQLSLYAIDRFLANVLAR